MPKNFDINDPKIQGSVLRALVSFGYKSIRGIFSAHNYKNLNNYELSQSITDINDSIAGCFLYNDSNASYYCANHTSFNWQDYLTNEQMFKLFIFQSRIIKEARESNKTLTQDRFKDIIYNVFNNKENKELFPRKFDFKDKCVLPSSSSPKRDFVEQVENKVFVLDKMFSETKDINLTKSEIQAIKQDLCVEKPSQYNGLVAEAFFRKRELEKSENTVEGQKEETEFEDTGYFTEQGVPVVILKSGVIATLAGGPYNGDLFTQNQDDSGEEFVWAGTIKEIFEGADDTPSENYEKPESESKKPEPRAPYKDDNQLTLFNLPPEE